MLNHLFNNTGRISRFIILRDRFRIPIWIISIAVFTFLVAISFADLYKTDEARHAVAQTMMNPAMTAMVGKGYGLDNYTFGAMMAHQMLLMTALVVGIMSILLVTRHTRADEEEGRIELIRSLPVGRLSNLHATMLVLFVTNILLALVIGFGLYALGIESMELEGSLLYGAALGATGMIFSSITALFAQLSASSRGTLGLSFAFLGAAYLIRAIGDIGNETLSWFSPFGWVLSSEVYVNNYWWPIILTVGVSICFVIISLYLNAIRDLESGFLPVKPGKKHASSFLLSTIGLTLRLQRTGLIFWAIGVFILGASYGSVLGDLESFISENEVLEKFLTPTGGVSLTEQFLTMLMAIISMICTIPPLMAMFKLRSEEKKNRTEFLLSRVISRIRLMGSYFIVSITVGYIMLSLAAIGLGSVGMPVLNGEINFSTFYRAAIVYLPAMWVMIGIAVFLIGLAPKRTGLTWIYLTFSFVVIYMGGLFQFPEWVGKLSPYGYIPKLPVEEMDFTKTSVLTFIALVLTVIGFIGYKNRNIHG